MTFLRCRAGASAVEAALILPVLIIVLLGILQFSLIYLQQDTMNNKLYDLASARDNAVITNDKAEITRQVCSTLMFVQNCQSTLLVELAPIDSYAVGGSPITGGTYNKGAAGNIMLLRAQIKSMNVLPGIGATYVKGTAIFSRS